MSGTVENLKNGANFESGIDLQNFSDREKLQQVFSKLDPEAIEKAKAVMKNPEEMKKLLSTPEAQMLMKTLGGGQRG